MTSDQRQKELEKQIRMLEGELARARRDIAALSQERIEYASILGNIPLFIMVVDKYRRVQKVSNAVLHMLGRVEEEVLGMRGGEALRCVHHLDDPQGCGFGPACESCKIRILVQDTLTNGKSHQRVEARLSMIGDAVEARNLLVSTTPIESTGVKKAQIFIEDVTEQKKLQDSLKKSEFHLKQAQSVASVGSWHLDIRNDVLTWSDQTYRMFGVERQTPLNVSAFLELVHPEDRPTVESAWQAAMKGVPYDIVHRIIVDEKIRWVHEKAQITFDEDSTPITCIGTVHDITRRKQADAVIENFFRQPMNIHLIAGFDGFIHRVNTGWQTILGYLPNEIEGTKFFDLIHPEDQDSTVQEMEKLGKGETTFYFENRYRHKDGGYRLLAWSAIAEVKDQLVYAVASDITERKQAEDALIHERDRLQEAISEIKTLSGLLPICSHCKKIRDDNGYWNQIEKYISERSDADFTHGYCPECYENTITEIEDAHAMIRKQKLNDD